MNKLDLSISFLILGLISSASLSAQTQNPAIKAGNVLVMGAMCNVMWKGELFGKMNLDTISNREGLYGVGPLEYLRGEILIVDGVNYISTVDEKGDVSVVVNSDVKVPFFVYANAIESDFVELELPSEIRSISDIEAFIDDATTDRVRPFVFKLHGTVSKANYHIQNLPLGTSVSNPDEAHSGQVKFELHDEEVDIIGFFSTEHQAVFTHHDTFLHMHIITEDRTKMGHLDAVKLENMTISLPKN